MNTRQTLPAVTPGHIWLITLTALTLVTLASALNPLPGFSFGIALEDLLPLLRQLTGTFLLATAVLLVLLAAILVTQKFATPQPQPRTAYRPQPRMHQQQATPHRSAPRPTPTHTPPPGAAPSSPLLKEAETLLTQARTIPNFSTTPLPGQQRVLAKLAENFIPAAHRQAAVALALLRLRRPVAA